ncbi:MAG: ammonium transporter [Acidobacteria bacterium]|nr:ammonium transporter [Acidobacteriota bacterium]MYC83846.1 ammonium transporter [Acidobacteriota bacterium]
MNGFLNKRRAGNLAGKTLLLVGCLLIGTTAAQAAVESEVVFVFNTFSFLLWGALVMWMCAGFTMLESGSVRTKNASMICLKNIGLYSIAGLAYYFIGYNLMYVDVGSVIGSFKFLYGPSETEVALLAATEAAAPSAELLKKGYSTMSDWFFQMVFVATAASIVSGTLAERVKMWPFFVFTLLLTGIIYPIVGAWTWGGGWLNAMGFTDFAGSTIVHSTGGWAALAGAMVVGPRYGKFRKDGTIKPTPPSNILVVTLGVFILWFGWFGFNGGSQLALGSAADVIAMSHVLVNTNLAAAAGVMMALAVSRPILGRMDLFAGLNGAIAGLVSITAAPDITDHYWAVIIGAIGGVLCTAGLKVLERVKLDDVVGAIPAHLFAGIWGTLAACIAGGGKLGVQLIGILAIGAFVFASSWVLWRLLDLTLTARVTRQVEQLGQDAGELGIEAYPEFVLMPEEEDRD